MDLHKIHHPANFDFVTSLLEKKTGSKSSGRVFNAQGRARSVELVVRDLGEDVFRLELRGKGLGAYDSRAGLCETFDKPSTARLQVAQDGSIRFGFPKGASSAEIVGARGGTFGLSGKAWMFRVLPEASDRYFGMGEKWGTFEKGGLRTQFWTTDVWGDYHPTAIAAAEVDSPYVAIPYLILRRNGCYFGVLLDCPHPAFMATNPVFSLTGGDISASPAALGTDLSGRSGELYFGAQDGLPIVYLIAGPSLPELTRKLQRLVGVTPRPPLWALGHQQCRWGYESLDDLEKLDAGFRKSGIPCDGLWLDIDYMDEFRVFSLREKNFRLTRREVLAKKPKAISELSALFARGRRVVPILDPGVKVDRNYSIYRRGLKEGHFCENPSGSPYVGIVWPGETHFPDFSQEKTVQFWAEEVARLSRFGFAAYWIDMNDPATGPVENRSMLFAEGTKSHGAFHNQYGHLMAAATRRGLLIAHPNERPFVLTRSAFIGTGRFAAVWTGDNISSFQHLEKSIATTLNLALSGIPFNGPDVPGFGGDAPPELAERWYEAACLFPFFRNHSIKGSRPQEPWVFPKETSDILRRYVTLRYRLLPYLYQLFVQQEATGEAILSPLFYHGESSGNELDVPDQFFVGEDLLVAPVVRRESEREVVLPAGSWFCLRTGRWYEGPRTLRIRVAREELALYVREGTVLPVSPDAIVAAVAAGNVSELVRLGHLELHVFSREGAFRPLRYEFDDGLSRAYEKGIRSRYVLQVERGEAGLSVRAEEVERASALPELRVERILWFGGKGGAGRRASSFTWSGVALAARASPGEEAL